MSEPTEDQPHGVFLGSLLRRGRDGFTGTLRADGAVSGTVTLAEGRVIAASTAVAPGPESLLLRSGRLAEADWTAAYTDAAPEGRLAEELLKRGLLGEVSLQVLTLKALTDAVFAMAICGVQTCVATPPSPDELPPLLPAAPGLTTRALADETTRRLASASRWAAKGLTVDTYLFRTTDSPAPATINGRRTPRDLAFLWGQGLYATLYTLADLLASTHITTSDSPRLTPPPTPIPLTPETLPQRQKGTSPVNTFLPFRPPS
ncbi:hypothetical protein [Actinocorallia longicatena]|uniref:Uncharacterized protein n=1 Tax=Actinocorallia longicatena TaxID=111803 RepID=A0ABP6QF87_9ACTN